MHMEMGTGMVTLMIRVVKGVAMLVGRLGSYLLELTLEWNFKFFFHYFSISNNDYNFFDLHHSQNMDVFQIGH